MTAAEIARVAPCAIRHIDLEQPLPDLQVGPGEGGLYAVFWRQGRPVGMLLFARAELPVTASALASVAATTVGTQSDPDPVPETEGRGDVSVVICTRDRPQDLARCLKSLLDCSPGPLEILVVDNAPQDDLTRNLVSGFAGVTYLREPLRGLSHARSCGARAARGGIVAFTDDDVEVSSNWIARVSAPFDDPEVACVTGLVLPATLSSEASCLFEFQIGGFGKNVRPVRFTPDFVTPAWWRSPEVWKIGAGANMAIRRSAFAKVGLFDPRLGAGASGCSEDSEFWFRLLRAGSVCQYDPAAVVFHYHRADRNALARQLRPYACGHVVALYASFLQDRRIGHLIRVFMVIPLYYCGLLADALVRRDRTALSLLFPQLRGFMDGHLQAVRWLRKDGPPPLGEHHGTSEPAQPDPA
jgi:GT2 family glycosyltransferase